MNSNDWRQPDAPAGDGDWRSQLQNDSRERIVIKMMDTVKRRDRRRVLSGREGDEEYRKMARRFEEKVYHEATSQSDYLRKISLKMLTIESQSIPPGALPSNFAGISIFPQYPASSDSTSQTSISDLQKEVYQKIRVMKDLHYLEILRLRLKVVSKMQQPDGDQRLSCSKQMLDRILQCLQSQPPLQQRQLLSPSTQFMLRNQLSHSHITQPQPQGNGVNSQLHSVHLQCDITSYQPNMMNSVQQVIGTQLSVNQVEFVSPNSSHKAGASTTKRAKKLYLGRRSISQPMKTRSALASAIRRSPRKLAKDKASSIQ